MAESRIQKSLLNAKVNLIFYALTLVLSFFSRKIFLNCLGTDFVGLTGTLQNLLGFLNLAELGIGAAIGYVLYKPLFDKDQPKITEIISVFGYLYSRIGYLILAGGILLSCFLPLIFPKTGFQWGVIYFAFYAFLFSSLIGYFCNYKQTLLGADQKNYVVTAYFQSANILKTLIQLVSAWYTKSFYLWIIIELIFGILYSLILNWKMKQTYPWLASEVSQGRALFKKYPEVMKYTKQLFIHKMGSFAQWQTAPFLVYSFVNLQTVAYYGNYTLITDKVSQLISNILESIGAGVGNLIAEGDRHKILNVFWELLSVRIFIGGFICFSIYTLLDSFIVLWLGENYLLSHLVLGLILTNVFLTLVRGGIGQFIFGYGLFQDVWASIAEVIINLSAACSLGFFYGLPGVIAGFVICHLIISLGWKPCFLFIYGFKKNPSSFYIPFLIFLSALISSWLLTNLCISENLAKTASLSVKNWLTYAAVSIIIFSNIFFGFLLLLSKGMRSFTARFFKLRTR